MKSRRRWANLLINPQLQIRYGALFLAISIFVHAISTVIASSYYVYWAEGNQESFPISVPVLVVVLIFIYLLIYGFSFVLGLLVTNRLYGPMVSIQRHFDSLKEGKLSSRLKLRSQDDEVMQRLAAEINELTAKLESLTNKGS